MQHYLEPWYGLDVLQVLHPGVDVRAEPKV